MDRKTFLKKTAGAILVAVPAYALLNCSSSDDSGGNNNNNNNNNNPDCVANGAEASSISANHGHSLTVSAADVNAGNEKTYSIQGSSGHNHEVTITAAQFATLANNQQIQVNSTQGNGHTHSVTVSCA